MEGTPEPGGTDPAAGPLSVAPTVRLAAVQAASVFLDREATVAKACRLIDEAGAHGARVIGFPESFVPGHPIWYRHLVADSAPARALAVRLFENAVEVPSAATEAIGDAARRASAYVAVGICERAPGTLGTLYNSLLFFGPDGGLLGCHRKIMPTGSERLVHAAGDGSTLRTVASPFGPIGGLICGEHSNSFPRLALLLQHERIHVACWPPFTSGANTGSDSIDIRARMHAFEGKLFVISAAGVVDPDCFAQLGIAEGGAGDVRGGHSGILNPRGEYLAGPAGDEETIVYADADEREIIQGKVFQDIAGHYNRFDLFQLTVRTPAQPALRFLDPRGDAD